MDNLKDDLNHATNNLDEGASHAAEDLQARAKDAWETVQHQTNLAVREGSAYVRENPVPTALGAFCLGLILGLLLSHREPASIKDRYIAEPLHNSKGVLLGLLLAFGTLLRRTLSSASSAAGTFAGNVGDDLEDSLKPLRKAARQTGRKLGL